MNFEIYRGKRVLVTGRVLVETVSKYGLEI